MLYTPEQHELYKKLIHTKEGIKLINRLKNTSLIRRYQLVDILRTAGVNEKLITKVKTIFYPKQTNFNVEEDENNPLSLKDLKITKQKIMTLFINEGLIPSYGKKQRKR